MSRLLVTSFCFMFVAATATAQDYLKGKWVENPERLSCVSACGDFFPLAPGKNAAGKRYHVCAARIDGDKSGLRPGYNVRSIPATCKILDGDSFVNAVDFSCFCVVTTFRDQD